MAKKVKKKVKRTAPGGGKSFAKGITPVEDLTDNEVMLVYGRSGSGKTHFSSTWPKPLLVIDVKEKGTATIKGIEGIEVRRITTWDEFEEGYWYLKDGTKYKTIVIDQVTNLQDLGMQEIRDRHNKKQSDLFAKNNWGELGGLLKDAINRYRDLDEQYNVVFIAHERTFAGGDEEDDALEPSIGARVMPSVGAFLDGAMDSIGSCFIRENWTGKGKNKVRKVEYCMRIGPHAYYSTKIRRPKSAGPLPDVITDPSHRKVRDLITGKSTAKKKVTKKRKKLAKRSNK